MSFGGPEADIYSEPQFDSIFNHTGVAFVAATGDSGAITSDNAYGGYPAFSPNVLAIGGTSLTVNGSGNYSSETTWNDTSVLEGSTGGD